jgi:DNA-binding CsgD family transcriptional regulator
MGSSLIGRAAERGVVERFLAADLWMPVALVIEGEPGVGKTTLWRDSVAVAVSRGYAVLDVAPAESEQSLSFAALADLLGQLPSEAVDAIPTVQRQVVDVVMLRREPEVPLDPRLVSTAVLNVLRAFSERQSVIVAVDDAQWLDGASARALAFAARRSPAHLRWLLSRRASTVSTDRVLDWWTDEQVDRIKLGGLSLAGFHRLIVERLGASLPRPVLARVHAAAGGNPLFGLEIAREIGLTRAHALGDPIPVPERLQTLLASRIRSLSPRAREAVLVAAALARPTAALITAAMGDERATNEALLEAEDAEVLIEDGQRLRFSHPLVAAAVLATTSPRRRRQLHAMLAYAVEDGEERAAHLARSSSRPDAELAAEIENGAQLAHRRGALDAAAELFEAAARCTPPADLDGAVRRLLGAAAALRGAYDVQAARAFAERAVEIAPAGNARAEALLLMGQLAWVDSPSTAVVPFLERALAEPVSETRLRARVHAALASFQIGAAAVAHARTATDLLDEETDAGLAAYVSFNRFLGEAMLGQPPDVALLERGLALERRAESESETSSIPMLWYQAMDDFDAARGRYEAVERWCSERGEDARLAQERALLAQVELRAGRWDLAEDLIEDSCKVLLAPDTSGAWALPFGIRAFIDTHRGRFARARSGLSGLIADRERTGDLWFATLFLFDLAFLEFSVGDYVATDRVVSQLSEYQDTLGIRDSPADRAEPFHVEALVAIGAVKRAREVLEQLERRASVWPRPNTAASLPRTRALVLSAEGDLTGGLAALGESDPTLATSVPFEHGCGQLVRGRLLRRAKQKRAAADALGDALKTFQELGAPSWIAQARSELDRVGLRHGASTQLTPTERQVAELAATGMTNRDVAAAAFMSPKTVEANLARVYRKLGIRSRAELGAVWGRYRD